jgi:putative flippase GtrA
MQACMHGEGGGLIAQARALFRRFERVIRYVLVGGAVTLLYTLMTAGLYLGHVVGDPTAASAISCLVTLPISFFAHRAVTYADVEREPFQWRRFALLGASSFIFSTGSVKVVDLLHGPLWIGLAIGFVLVPLANYSINTIWVFRTKHFLALHQAKVTD